MLIENHQAAVSRYEAHFFLGQIPSQVLPHHFYLRFSSILTKLLCAVCICTCPCLGTVSWLWYKSGFTTSHGYNLVSVPSPFVDRSIADFCFNSFFIFHLLFWFRFFHALSTCGWMRISDIPPFGALVLCLIIGLNSKTSRKVCFLSNYQLKETRLNPKQWIHGKRLLNSPCVVPND